MQERSPSTADYLLYGPDPVALIATFQLRDDAPRDRFVGLWNEVAHLMEERPGFISSGLYRARVGADANEYIMVAHWTCPRLLAIAQADPEIRSVQRGLHKLLVGVRRVLWEAATETIVPRDSPPASARQEDAHLAQHG